MSGSGGRGQLDPRRGRVRAQLRHTLAGRLDVHGGNGHPGRMQQPGRRLLQDTGRHGVPGRPVQQRQQQLGADNPQPQQHRPVTGVVGERDELLAVHGTTARHPSGPGISKHDADNRHDGPPGAARQRLGPHSLVSDDHATGYPPPTDRGNRHCRSQSARRDSPDRRSRAWHSPACNPHVSERRVPRRQMRAGCRSP